MVTKIFEKPDFIAQTLGLDLVLVKGLIKISSLLNRLKPVNIQEYKKTASDCIEILTKRYNYFSITPHIHKIVIHGTEMVAHIQKSGFGPGITSEQSDS